MFGGLRGGRVCSTCLHALKCIAPENNKGISGLPCPALSCPDSTHPALSRTRTCPTPLSPEQDQDLPDTHQQLSSCAREQLFACKSPSGK